MPPMTVDVGRAVGSATVKSPTTLLVAPPLEIFRVGPPPSPLRSNLDRGADPPPHRGQRRLTRNSR